MKADDLKKRFPWLGTAQLADRPELIQADLCVWFDELSYLERQFLSENLRRRMRYVIVEEDVGAIRDDDESMLWCIEGGHPGIDNLTDAQLLVAYLERYETLEEFGDSNIDDDGLLPSADDRELAVLPEFHEYWERYNAKRVAQQTTTETS